LETNRNIAMAKCDVQQGTLALKALRRFRNRLAASVFGRRHDRRIQEELDDHVRLLMEDYLRAGLPLHAARRKARLTLGAFEATVEAYRDEERLRGLENLSQDFTTAARTVWRSKGFALTAVVTLALGLGVNIVAFSLLNAVRRPQLPYLDLPRLVSVTAGYAPNGWVRHPLSLAAFLDIRRDATTLAPLAAYCQRRVSFASDRSSTRVAASLVSSNLWETLGVAPLIGRGFIEEEDRAGVEPVVIIGYRLWQARMGGERSVLDRRVTIDGVRRRVVGVMPDGWRFPEVEDVWLPMGAAIDADPTLLAARDVRNWRAVGRLSDSATLERAVAEVQALGRREAETDPRASRGWTLEAGRLDRESFEQTGGFFAALQLAALLVALLVGANLANLFLARAEARHRELAIRASLGAPRGRLVRLVLIESTAVALLGAAIGLALSAWALPLVEGVIPEAIPFFIRFRIDTSVVVFAVALALVTAVLAGWAGAWRAGRTAPRDALADNGATVTGSRTSSRARSAFVFAQAAVAVALLASALTVARGLLGLSGMDTGQDWRRMLIADVPLSGPRYVETDHVHLLATRLVEALSTLPRVEGVAVSSGLSIAASPDGAALSVEGLSEPIARANAPAVESVSHGYLRATGTRLVAGRDLGQSDTLGAAPVVLINEEAQRRYFRGEDAIGRRLFFGASANLRQWRTVVGVVQNTRPQPLDPEIEPRLYVPWEQAPSRALRVTLRTSGEPALARNALVRTVATIDPTLAVEAPMTGAELMALALWPVWFFNGFVLVFAAFAIIVAMLGVYGMTRYFVLARRREIAVRVALGARSGTIVQLLARHTGLPLLLGMLVGLGAAGVGLQVLAAAVPGTTPLSVPVVAAVLAVVGLAAVAAVAPPARHALRVAPIDVLRLG
jgi:predicted permease